MFLEIRHLRSLLAIDEEANLARAAERVHLTQSAQSHQIKAMEQYSCEPLFGYEARLVTAHNHPLAAKPYIEPADLTGETLITYPVQRQRRDVYSRFLQPSGVEPAAVRQAELTAVILLLVASRRGVAVLPDWVVDEAVQKSSLATRPLTRVGMHGTLYAAVRAAVRDCAYLRVCVALARAREAAAPG